MLKVCLFPEDHCSTPLPITSPQSRKKKNGGWDSNAVGVIIFAHQADSKARGGDSKGEEKEIPFTFNFTPPCILKPVI